MLVFAILTIASVSCRSFEKRYAEAEPGFHNIPSSVVSHSYDYCYELYGPAGCGQNVGGYTFNRQNIQNHATHFNQQYNQGSRDTNFSHGKKKRSAEADAAPGFTQTFQPGLFSQSYDCQGGPKQIFYGGATVNSQPGLFSQSYDCQGGPKQIFYEGATVNSL